MKNLREEQKYASKEKDKRGREREREQLNYNGKAIIADAKYIAKPKTISMLMSVQKLKDSMRSVHFLLCIAYILERQYFSVHPRFALNIAYSVQFARVVGPNRQCLCMHIFTVNILIKPVIESLNNK